MKTRILASLFALFASAFSAFAASGTAIPGGNQTTTFVITKPGSYYLAANRVMTDPTKNAIEIKTTDVTLDLNGFSLSFSDTDGSTDLINIPQAQNVEISNGSLVNAPRSAIYTDQGMNLRVLNVRIVETANGAGVYSGADATVVEGCNVSYVGAVGINCYASGSVVRRCSVTDAATHGINVGGSCVVTDCVVRGAQLCGISAHSSCTIANNQVSNNNLAKNGNYGGIWVESLCTVRGNTLIYNYNSIVAVDGDAFVDRNTITAVSSLGSALVNKGAQKSLYRDNIFAGSGAQTVGLWTNVGGNVTP